jgi:hypothetical protein
MTEDKPIHISAEDARGGDIVLRTRSRRLIIFAGFAGIVVVLLVAWLLG